MLKAKIIRSKKVDLPDKISGPTKVKVGLISGVADQDNINKGIWNEFGTSRGIPERPFMRNSLRNNSDKYIKALQTSAQRLALGQTDLSTVMEKLGNVAELDIKREIDGLKSPPNAPSTIRQKGSSNPLIDTGEMRNSVRYKVES